MLKVCLDLSSGVQQAAGISRYETKLAEAMLKQAGPERFTYMFNGSTGVLPSSLPLDLRELPHKKINRGNKAWRLEILSRHLAGLKMSQSFFPGSPGATGLFHGMDNIAPPVKSPTVITIFDLSFRLFPQFHSRWNRNFLSLAIPICARKASRIIVISENTRKDLVNWLGKEIENKIRVTPLGVSSDYFPETLLPLNPRVELSKYGLESKPFILSVGTLEPRKNQARLVEAYAEFIKISEFSEEELPLLVLLGKKGWGGEYERIRETAGRSGFPVIENAKPRPGRSGQILLVTEANDPVLKAFYSQAKLVCYCSIYEGFGLPALEALAAGKALITSNNSSIPEVTGPDNQTALQVDPLNPGEIVQALKKVFSNENLIQHLALEGRKRAKLFTWDKTAHLTLEVYQQVLSPDR